MTLSWIHIALSCSNQSVMGKGKNWFSTSFPSNEWFAEAKGDEAKNTKETLKLFLWHFSYKDCRVLRFFCLHCKSARKSHVWENWKTFLCFALPCSVFPPYTQINDYVGKFEFNRARRSSFLFSNVSFSCCVFMALYLLLFSILL